ncbi:MAG: hypothetical protein ACHQD7_01260 [Chitinophagales bacterium]
MSTIKFKSANLPTSVSRAKIRKAVEEAFVHFDLPQSPFIVQPKRNNNAIGEGSV